MIRRGAVQRILGNEFTGYDGHSTGIYSWELLLPTNRATIRRHRLGFVSFDGTIVALHWLTAGAIAEDRDE